MHSRDHDDTTLRIVGALFVFAFLFVVVSVVVGTVVTLAGTPASAGALEPVVAGASLAVTLGWLYRTETRTGWPKRLWAVLRRR